MDSQEKNQIPYNDSFICPHCETRAQFNLIFPDFNSRDGDNFIANLKKASWDEQGKTFTYTYQVWKCQVCEKLVFRAIKNYKYGSEKIIGQFPSSIRSDSSFSGSVPKAILEDFESALKCFEFDEYRPVVAMCRRALQASVLEQGAGSEKDLIDQIDELNKTKPDRFTTDIKDWAHNIRIFGNWGVHPDKDGLKDVKQEIAKEVIDFLKSYFHYVYVMPQKVANARLKQKPQEKEE